MVNGPGNIPDFLKAAPLPPPPAPKTVIKSQQSSTPPPPPKHENEPAATVTLSEQAQHLLALRPKLQSLEDVRPSRVEEARAAVTRVTQNPEAINAKLAEKLLTGS